MREVGLWVKPSLLWVDCYRGCGFVSQTGCCRACGYEFHFCRWSGHFLFVYSVSEYSGGQTCKKTNGPWSGEGLPGEMKKQVGRLTSFPGVMKPMEFNLDFPTLFSTLSGYGFGSLNFIWGADVSRNLRNLFFYYFLFLFFSILKERALLSMSKIFPLYLVLVWLKMVTSETPSFFALKI